MSLEIPNVLSCPECGALKTNCDSEGACECANGHQFWDTNSPEWLMIRRAQRAEAREKGLHEALAELVRLKDLKAKDPTAYEREGAAKDRAWATARKLLRPVEPEQPPVDLAREAWGASSEAHIGQIIAGGTTRSFDEWWAERNSKDA